MAITNAQQLIEDNETAFLHADVCLGSPESYSRDDKRQICENIDATNSAIDAAMHNDFEALPRLREEAPREYAGRPWDAGKGLGKSILLDFDSIPDAPPLSA